MKCDYCNKEFTDEDEIICENGFVYHEEHKDVFNPYGRHKGMDIETIDIVWGARKGVDVENILMEHPWIYGIYTDDDKATFVRDYMQESDDFGHLQWMISIGKIVR